MHVLPSLSENLSKGMTKQVLLYICNDRQDYCKRFEYKCISSIQDIKLETRKIQANIV